MKVTVEHHSTRENAMQKLDLASDKLMAIEIRNVEIADQKKSWSGSVMNFSLTGKMGFISLPLAGTVTVDDTNVTLDCELPSLIRNTMGEEKVRAAVEQNIRALVS